MVGLLTALVCGRSYSWSNGGFSLPDIVSGLVAGVKDVSRRWVAALAEGRSEGGSSGFSVHARGRSLQAWRLVASSSCAVASGTSGYTPLLSPLIRPQIDNATGLPPSARSSLPPRRLPLACTVSWASSTWPAGSCCFRQMLTLFSWVGGHCNKQLTQQPSSFPYLLLLTGLGPSLTSADVCVRNADTAHARPPTPLTLPIPRPHAG